MAKSTVQVTGPNFEGTYNVLVIEDHGVFGMSLSLDALAELHKQLGALLNGKVKDQPRRPRFSDVAEALNNQGPSYDDIPSELGGTL